MHAILLYEYSFHTVIEISLSSGQHKNINKLIHICRMSELFNLMKKINLSQEKAMCNKFAELKKMYCWRHTNGEFFLYLGQFLRIDQDKILKFIGKTN